MVNIKTNLLKVKLTIIASFIILSSVNIYGQDPHFTQFYANPLYLNPAFAGSAICPRLILNYRNQWPSIPGTFITYNASYDQHIDGIAGGIGLLFNADRAGEGTLNTTMFNFMYSYKLDVSQSFSIRAGVQASYFQKRVDWSKLTFGDMIDEKYGFIFPTQEQQTNSVGTTDFSAGLLGYGEIFTFGVAVHHLTRPNESLTGGVSRLPMKYTVHTGFIIDLKSSRRKRRLDDPVLAPNIIYQQQLNFQQLNYGLYFNRYPFVGGIWYRQSFRNSDAVILLFGVQNNLVKFGYSYDLTVSKLTNASGGAHEISFAYQFDCFPKKRRIRTIKCPSF